VASIGRPITLNERMADISLRLQHLHTIGDRYDQYHQKVETRLHPYFEQAGMPYPPDHLILVAIKQEKLLQIYAVSGTKLKLVRTYPILAASGTAGPKLQEGDRQVPEGVYSIEKLNPNSAYHLALRVGYPNQFDLAQSAADGRTDLGGDIMIHGSNKSAGCLAMGDENIEDIFVLSAEVGAPQIKLIITPVDFRTTDQLPADTKIYPWSNTLYTHIKQELASLPE
jgi:murein L,D-transpeptidase YafK